MNRNKFKALSDALSMVVFIMDLCADNMDDVINMLLDESKRYDNHADMHASRLYNVHYIYTYERDMVDYFRFKAAIMTILAAHFTAYRNGETDRAFPWDASSYIPRQI